jgi:hypothetical protein
VGCSCEHNDNLRLCVEVNVGHAVGHDATMVGVVGEGDVGVGFVFGVVVAIANVATIEVAVGVVARRQARR